MRIIDSAGFLMPRQWRRLLHLHVTCPSVFVLIAGDAGQFPPIDDDCGVASDAMLTNDDVNVLYDSRILCDGHMTRGIHPKLLRHPS